jgi:glycosyltransferase involved in cell wall biosynthesis
MTAKKVRMNFKDLSSVELGGGLSGKPLRVCLVSFLGGGVGTATSALAKLLANGGHDATILCTQVEGGKPAETPWGAKSWQERSEDLSASGVRLEFIPHQGSSTAWLEKSWQVMKYLGKRDFDLVYFDDCYGSGYYSLLAKRAGMAPFSQQILCVIAHASRQWIADSNDQFLHRTSDLELIGLERRSIELADVVIAPSQYLLREYQSYGWRLPQRTFCQFYPLINSVPDEGRHNETRVDEIVFFGRLETRKGLWLFTEALDRLGDLIRGKTVTFLGQITEAHGVSTGTRIISSSRNWPCRVQLLTDFDTRESIDYLRAGRRLAVMPSLADNSPCTVYECLEAGSPFVTTSGSGTEELIDRKSWPEAVVAPEVSALSARISRALQKGIKPATPSFDPRVNLSTWSAWHRYLGSKGKRELTVAGASDASTSNPGPGTAQVPPVVVIVDQGLCPLGLLIDNLASHVRRLGSLATFVVISSRKGLVETVLSSIFAGERPPSLRFFDSSTLDDARRTISKAQFAFFLDADVEMLTPFFVLALDVLARQTFAVVTSLSATRRNKAGAAEIEELAAGDLPGALLFGTPIGGSVWAMSPAAHGPELLALEISMPNMDTFHSAAVIGQLFMQRAQVAGRGVELLPMVGGISTADRRSQAPLKTLTEIRAATAQAGIASSFTEGGAAWFAVAAFGIGPEVKEMAIPSLSALPPAHPLSAINPGDGDLAKLAAALGRTDLALQIEASRGGSAERVRQLIDVAVESVRQRPSTDLADLLGRGNVIRFGPRQLALKRVGDGEEDARGHSATARRDAIGLPVAVYLDERLRLAERRILSASPLLTGGPGRLFFFDVPLCSNASFLFRLRSGSPNPLFLRAKVFDQETGDEIGSVSTRIGAYGELQEAIPLPEIFAQATIAMEFSGGKLDLFAEQMVVW